MTTRCGSASVTAVCRLGRDTIPAKYTARDHRAPAARDGHQMTAFFESSRFAQQTRLTAPWRGVAIKAADRSLAEEGARLGLDG
jgi:hypothetical protein